ncbi:MAG: hypothetical protein AAFY65_18155 [Pseudomonadota bacterium]
MKIDDLVQLADRIRQHAYIWGPSRLMRDLDAVDLEGVHDRYVTPFKGGPVDPFPGETSYECEIETNMDDVLGIETDGRVVLVFTPDGRYAKLSWDRLPTIPTDDGSEVKISNVNDPNDAQKPYETHGFN